MSREAMQMALEALESDPVSHLGLVHRKLAITALRHALDTEQEPVAWRSTSPDEKLFVGTSKEVNWTPIYTEPQKKEWVGLTDEEIEEIVGPWGGTPIKGYTRKLFDQIEAKLREKNQ